MQDYEEIGSFRFISIIPVRAKAVAVDWSQTCRLLEDTIRSILKSPKDVIVIIVSTDEPDICVDLKQDSRVFICSDDYPIPRSKEEQMKDKVQKICDGLECARPHLPAWIMKMDADDLLSKRFVPYLASLKGVAHCAIDRGYVWESGSAHLTQVRDFHRLCGSSLATYVVSLPEDVREHWLVAWGHHVAVESLLSKGESVVCPAFPAAIYRVATGDNHSGMAWQNMGNSRKIQIRRWLARRRFTPAVRHEFGLE